MTCPACGFENLRRSQVCAHCGAKLIWDGPSDREYFIPPRAGRSKIVYPLRLFFQRVVIPPLLAMTEICAGLRQALRQGWRGLPEARRRAAVLSVIPGLGHFFLRAVFPGIGLLAVWLAIVIYFFFLRAAWSRLFLFSAAMLWLAAMLVHVLAVVSAAGPDRHCRTAGEAKIVAFCLSGIVLAGYLAAAFIIQQYPVTIHVPVVQRFGN
jgi:hypothetical protein